MSNPNPAWPTAVADATDLQSREQILCRSVGVSLKHQRNYAWALTLLSSHMHLELGCVIKG